MYYQLKFYIGEKLNTLAIEAENGSEAVELVKNFVYDHYNGYALDKLKILQIRQWEYKMFENKYKKLESYICKIRY